MKKQLGEILLQEGVITKEDLQEVLKIQKKSPLKLGQILQKKGLADEDQILKTLAHQFGYEYESRLNFKFDDAFKKIPVNLLQKAKMVPVARTGKSIKVALSDPADLHPADDLRNILSEFRVNFVLAPEAEVLKIIHGQFDQAANAAKEVMEGISEDEFQDIDALGDDTLDLANEAPIIRMVNAILTQGVQERASDIHIEPFEKAVEVRYRVDGILHKRLSPPKVIHAGIVSRIKIMANLNIAENRLPQDGRIKIKLAGKDVDIRVSTIPTRHGERVVMRLLNKSDVKFTLANMGLPKPMFDTVQKLLREPNGIILVTGPTGSGKSTTLYAFLQEMNQESRNILTAEDPVEYEIEGISQMQMQDKIGLTFATALRAMLRQDPDVIMVGEIRDQETARIAIQAALTGHLVLSTLHTNDAPSAVTRLVDMGIEPYLITSTVRAVLAQRLSRVLCPSCKAPFRAPARELASLGITASESATIYKHVGCENCTGTGYRGRTGIYELMLMDEDVQRVVIRGGDSEAVKKVALEKGMETLQTYGKNKVLDGVTTIEEILRVT